MIVENNNASSTNNYTVPNQKTVIVHREMPVKDFLQIKNENWMEVNKKFTPYGFAGISLPCREQRWIQFGSIAGSG